MKQLLQNLRTGETEVADVPAPSGRDGHLLIRTSRSLVSAGTERMLVEFGKAGFIDKALQQPDRVRQVLDKVKTDGLAPTITAVRNRLDQPLTLGYCNVGTVIDAGAGTQGFAPGDRVASNGPHAEVVSVPVNLSAKIPDGVSDEAAAFTVVGAVALQGIRLVQPTLGEAVVVTGLGLIGLLTVQLLRSHGCRVLGLDFDTDRLEIARRFGAETVDLSAGADPLAAAQAFSRGRGVDAVIVTAATKSSEPMHQAAQMCRKRGRIVLVGVAGLELSRDDFYEKELTFQVSCSYGPGRYDPNYEDKGQDYPASFVRWTEQRNFEAVLDMLAVGQLDVGPLISHRFAITDAEAAYAVVTGTEPSLGILLEHPDAAAYANLSPRQRKIQIKPNPLKHDGKPTIGIIGAGNYASGVLIPALHAAGARLKSVASSAGVSGLVVGRKFGFEETTTDAAHVLGDPEVDALVIATRHDTHASFVLQAIEAGKSIFVEKPLCLMHEELTAIEAAYVAKAEAGKARPLMVGFNRRFAPHVRQIRALLEEVSEPKAFTMTVNAGAVPLDHWTQDPQIGGGRIVGEACHFIDLLRFLAGAPIEKAHAAFMQSRSGDTASFNLTFADGSIGTIHYYANGNRSFPKERLEVFCAGRVLQLDNFRRLKGFGWPGLRGSRLWRQDKGQHACARAFVEAVREGGPPPIPFDQIIEVSRVSIKAANST